MTPLSEELRCLTFINVLKVAPAHQQRLVDLLAQVTEGSVRRSPGFLSARLPRSLDGTRVPMCAQWRSMEGYEAVRKDPAPAPFLAEALTLATFEPVAYEVVRSFAPPPSV